MSVGLHPRHAWTSLPVPVGGGARWPASRCIRNGAAPRRACRALALLADEPRRGRRRGGGSCRCPPHPQRPACDRAQMRFRRRAGRGSRPLELGRSTRTWCHDHSRGQRWDDPPRRHCDGSAPLDSARSQNADAAAASRSTHRSMGMTVESTMRWYKRGSAGSRSKSLVTKRAHARSACSWCARHAFGHRLERHALGEAAIRWPGESNVERHRVVGQHDRRCPTKDDATTGGRDLSNACLDPPSQLAPPVQIDQRRRRQPQGATHLAQTGHDRTGRRLLFLLHRQALAIDVDIAVPAAWISRSKNLRPSPAATSGAMMLPAAPYRADTVTTLSPDTDSCDIELQSCADEHFRHQSEAESATTQAHRNACCAWAVVDLQRRPPTHCRLGRAAAPPVRGDGGGSPAHQGRHHVRPRIPRPVAVQPSAGSLDEHENDRILSRTSLTPEAIEPRHGGGSTPRLRGGRTGAARGREDVCPTGRSGLAGTP